ncbi:hypothetical protein PT974_08467 [Cladobotryum mycophilum]|uniref:HNH nuclease domain-containing protein n=1 Tax=Cladobotryum mycophilum TaxID=491253 RepID=A0ABR0SET6_9HYPO
MDTKLYIDALLVHLSNETTSAQDKHELMQNLKTRPKTSIPSPILPMDDDIELKLELIESVRGAYNSLDKNKDIAFSLTNIQLATFLHISVETLWAFVEPMHIHTYLSMHKLLTFSNTGRIPGEDSNTGSTNSKVSRNMTERESTKGACILTNVAHPIACHIVPFALNSSAKNINHYSTLEYFVPALLGANWNMICLHRYLHSWWSAGYFALQWLGSIRLDDELDNVKVQFHWMPRNGLKPHEKADIHIDHLLRIAAMAGAAGAPELLENPDESDYDTDDQADVISWLSDSSA